MLPKIILGLDAKLPVKSVPPVRVNPPMTPEVAVTAPVNEPVAALSVPANVAVPSDKIENVGTLFLYPNSPVPVNFNPLFAEPLNISSPVAFAVILLSTAL